MKENLKEMILSRGLEFDETSVNLLIKISDKLSTDIKYSTSALTDIYEKGPNMIQLLASILEV